MLQDINIIGAGNIGFSLGFLLSRQGYPITLTGRDPIRQIIANGKVNIKTDNGVSEVKLYDNLRYESQPDIQSESITIVTTKTFDIAKCLSEYPQALNSKKLVFLQNGLSPESIFIQYLNDTKQEYNGENYGGVIFGTAKLDLPDTLETKLNKIVLGSINPSLYNDGILDISNEFSLPCIHYSSSSEDYLKQRATKLMYNSTNILCFLFNMTLGEMAQNKITKGLFKDRIKEMGEFFRVSTLDIETIYDECLTLCRNRFSNHLPSIVQDVYKLNDSGFLYTEIDQIDRSIVTSSRIPMPVCESILLEAELMVSNINQTKQKFENYLRLAKYNRQKYGVEI
jgi:2-dehydropantoate 2-reductase